MDNTILMLGPTQAGKTTLIGALSLAAPLSQTRVPVIWDGNTVASPICPFRFSLIPRPVLQPVLEPELDPQGTKGKPIEVNTMKQLSIQARMSVLEGSLSKRIAGTSTLTVYAFDLTVDLRNTPEKLVAHNIDEADWIQTARFEIYDGPGRAVFGDSDPKIRAAIVQKAQSARGIILCMDVVGSLTQAEYFIYLSSFLEDVGGGGPLPFERIVIVLTKADRFGVKKTSFNRFIVENADASERVIPMLTDVGLGMLVPSTSPSCRIYCGWSSAYGFLRHTGEPNFDFNNDGFANYQPGKGNVDQILHDWEPFRVADPFIFAMTGQPCSLRPLQWK